MNKKKTSSIHNAEWAKAKKLCRLNADDIRMAKELGFKPKSLIKNIPNPSETWKVPVKDWIYDLYSKRLGSSPQKQKTPLRSSEVSPAYHKNQNRNVPEDSRQGNEEIRDRLDGDIDEIPF